MPTKAELYRVFDANGMLLYVGISISAIQRASQHRANSEWWQYASRIEIKRYASRRVAAAAEKRAIKRERPKHNVAMQVTDRDRLDLIDTKKAARRAASG